MSFLPPPQPQAAPKAPPSSPRGDQAGLVVLADLSPGDCATIDSLAGNSPLVRRLQDLGLVPGTELRVLRRAPLGDPIAYELRGYRLCLRASEARCVLVRRRELVAPTPLHPRAPRRRGGAV